MKTIVIESDYLAPFFVLDKDLEPVPESFRGQPTQLFEITFDAYLEFIEFYLGSVNWLSTPTVEIKTNLRLFRQERSESARQALFRFFQRDVAFAVFKELHYCALYGMEASNIVHSVRGGRELTTEFIEGIYYTQEAQNVITIITSQLQQRDYHLDVASLSIRNEQHWKYAVTLFYLSTLSYPDWSYKPNQIS